MCFSAKKYRSPIGTIATVVCVHLSIHGTPGFRSPIMTVVTGLNLVNGYCDSLYALAAS